MGSPFQIYKYTTGHSCELTVLVEINWRHSVRVRNDRFSQVRTKTRSCLLFFLIKRMRAVLMRKLNGRA